MILTYIELYKHETNNLGLFKIDKLYLLLYAIKNITKEKQGSALYFK